MEARLLTAKAAKARGEGAVAGPPPRPDGARAREAIRSTAAHRQQAHEVAAGTFSSLSGVGEPQTSSAGSHRAAVRGAEERAASDDGLSLSPLLPLTTHNTA